MSQLRRNREVSRQMRQKGRWITQQGQWITLREHAPHAQQPLTLTTMTLTPLNSSLIPRPMACHSLGAGWLALLGAGGRGEGEEGIVGVVPLRPVLRQRLVTYQHLILTLISCPRANPMSKPEAQGTETQRECMGCSGCQGMAT
jgi:hypothetical protein